MDSKMLSAISGIVLSLAFFYIPGLNDWYNKQTSQAKSLIMLGVMLVVAAASFGLACWGIFDIPITCDKAGAVGLFQAFVYALVANQATYTVVRKLAPQ